MQYQRHTNRHTPQSQEHEPGHDDCPPSEGSELLDGLSRKEIAEGDEEAKDFEGAAAEHQQQEQQQ
jgi:hypothetical protein